MISRTILLVFSLALSSGFHLDTFAPSFVYRRQQSSCFPSFMRVVKGSELPSSYGYGYGREAKRRASLALRTMDTRLLVTKNRDDEGSDDHGNEDMSSHNDLRPSYFALGALLFTFISNQWARQSIYYLCDFSADATAFKHINIGIYSFLFNYAFMN